MSSAKAVMGLALLVVVASSRSVPAQPQFYHACFPAGADGSMNCYPGEGYSIGAAGVVRLSKYRQHFAFMGFNVPCDGSDGTSWAFPGAGYDGVPLPAWVIGKKVFQATLYLRDAANQTCDPWAPPNTYINDPVVIIGFRLANGGPFVDRGADGVSGALSGCCADYNSPTVVEGMNTPIAWRAGPPPYSQKGDGGTGSEWYAVSFRDSTCPGAVLAAGSGPFDPDGDGYGGYSGLLDAWELRIEDNMFAFPWLVYFSDAHSVNSQTLDTADCSGPYGGDEPRDRAQDSSLAEGWYAVPLDCSLVHALATDPECKGLVFSSAATANGPGVGYGHNTQFFARDQNSNTDGPYTPYLWLLATLCGDVTNEGCVDVIDVLFLAGAFGSRPDSPNWYSDADLNLDEAVDISDLLLIARDWGQCL